MITMNFLCWWWIESLFLSTRNCPIWRNNFAAWASTKRQFRLSKNTIIYSIAAQNEESVCNDMDTKLTSCAISLYLVTWDLDVWSTKDYFDSRIHPTTWVLDKSKPCVSHKRRKIPLTDHFGHSFDSKTNYGICFNYATSHYDRNIHKTQTGKCIINKRSTHEVFFSV